MEALEQLGIVPVDYSVLISLFSEYKFPKNKIVILERKGKLIRLRKGYYVVSPAISKKLLSVELIANHLYGPSYVSMESALRYYGLIPEKVYSVRSMTTNRSKKYENQIAVFDYISVPEKYYPIGIEQKIVNGQFAFLIASPEKALCDMISSTPGLRIQSVKSMAAYLEQDLRFDMSALNSFDQSIIKRCAETGKKKSALKLLLKLIEQ